MANVKINNCLKHIFAITLTISDILKIQNLFIQKVGQGHGVQFSQWYHSVLKGQVHKYLPHIFPLVLIVSDILKEMNIWSWKSRSRSLSAVFLPFLRIKICIFTLKKLVKVKSAIFAITPVDVSTYFALFCATSSYRFRDFSIVYLQK